MYNQIEIFHHIIIITFKKNPINYSLTIILLNIYSENKLHSKFFFFILKTNKLNIQYLTIQYNELRSFVKYLFTL